MGIHGPLVLATKTRARREEGDRNDRLSSCHYESLVPNAIAFGRAGCTVIYRLSCIKYSGVVQPRVTLFLCVGVAGDENAPAQHWCQKWDKELEGPYWRTSRRGDPASRPVVPTPCPGFLGGFPLGVKANAEAAVWRSHAANTTTSSDQGTKIRRSIRRGRDARFSGGGSSVASTP